MSTFERIIRAFINALRRNIVSTDKYNFEQFSPQKLTTKEHLIQECKKLGVSIYIDDHMEQTKGIYARIFRSVASETELEQRLNAKKTIILATVALLISAITLYYKN